MTSGRPPHPDTPTTTSTDTTGPFDTRSPAQISDRPDASRLGFRVGAWLSVPGSKARLVPNPGPGIPTAGSGGRVNFVVENEDEFRASMAPHVQGMRQFCEAIDAVADRHGQLHDASSGAMKELAAESDYRAASTWQNPITDTHTFGGITLRAATDHVCSFAQLFDTEQPPVYGHAVIARARFESSTVSAWLNEPRIGVPERIRRGL